MKLNEWDHNRILTFYREGLAKYGDSDAKSVRWSSRHGQLQRFRVLSYIADLNGKRILDVGCGLGELYKFFLQNEIEVDYTGIDVVPEFITAAQQRFPNGHFIHQDVFEVTDAYDFVLASGALSFKVENNETFYKQMISKMYDLAQEGVAFNMLDRDSHIDDETYAAYTQSEIVDYCSTLAHRVEVIADYIPKDFTLFMYR